MRIIVVGGAGTIGKRVVNALKTNHDVLTAGRNSGDIRVDICSTASVEKMFSDTGTFDACICTAGTGYYGDFQLMPATDMLPGIQGKLLGQVNLVLIGKNYINREGSFTLTSGIASEHPAKNGACVALINGAVNSFVLAAAQELKNDLRINAVSPGLVEDSRDRYQHLFPGFNPAPMNKVVNAYLLSVEGAVNGRILKVYS